MWPTSASRTAYANRWIEVSEDVVQMPDGSEGVYGVVTVRHASVFVVAITDADEVVLVQLDRHTTGPGLEVPAGGTANSRRRAGIGHGSGARSGG